jgi:hypothetical protein
MTASNGKHKTPYEEKFADLIVACDNPPAEVFIVNRPETLGDNYEELVESLNRIADSGMKLLIVPRKERRETA